MPSFSRASSTCALAASHARHAASRSSSPRYLRPRSSTDQLVAPPLSLSLASSAARVASACAAGALAAADDAVLARLCVRRIDAAAAAAAAGPSPPMELAKVVASGLFCSLGWRWWRVGADALESIPDRMAGSLEVWASIRDVRPWLVPERWCVFVESGGSELSRMVASA